VIRVLMKSEAAPVILASPPLRMPSHPLKTSRDQQQQQRVASG
jgi:hypothetical protein